MALHCGLYIKDQDAYLVQVEQNNAELPKLRSHQPLGKASKGLSDLLAPLIKPFGLRNAYWYLSLEPVAHPLHLVDLPPASNEQQLSQLIRFQSQELLGVSSERVHIDFLPLPSQAWRGQKNMGFIVADSAGRLEQFSFDLMRLGLRQPTTEVSELSLARLALLASHSARPAVAINLGHKTLFMAYAMGQLCLIRLLEHNLDCLSHFDAPEVIDGLAIELQRSLDFFENQMSLNHGTELILLMAETPNRLALQQLQASIPCPVTRFQLADHCDLGGSKEAALWPYLPALGAALRQGDHEKSN